MRDIEPEQHTLTTLHPRTVSQPHQRPLRAQLGADDDRRLLADCDCAKSTR